MRRFYLILLSLVLLSFSTVVQGADPIVYKGDKVTANFYGFVRTVGFADFGGSVPNYDFRNALITTPNSWESDSRLSFDASGTRFGLSLIRKSGQLGDVKMVIETDFRGSNDLFRIRHAYIDVKGFLLGQTWTFFGDNSALAPTIDVQGINSRTFIRTALLGYRTELAKGLTFGVSLEMPVAKITGIGSLRSVTQRLPDIPLYLNYKGKRGHLKLAGVLRQLEYGNFAQEERERITGYGGQISGSLNVTSGVKLYSQAIYGTGIARYINDLALLALDLVPVTGGTELQTIDMFSASIGIRATLSKEVYCSANFSMASLADKSQYEVDQEYLRGSYLSASLFWEPIKAFTFGAEYIRGGRENIGGDKGSANRFQMMFMYSF